MLADGKLSKDQILSYFTRPDRTVNPWRLAEISKGEIHGDAEPATPGQVAAYIRTFRSPDQARRSFFEENPLHPVNLRMLFRLKEGTTDILAVTETDRVECKESFHRRGEGRAKFAKTIAGFSNARGGFLLFGVRDDDLKVVGVDPAVADSFDGADLDCFLSDAFAPAPLWESATYGIGGKTIFIIHVREAPRKPVICTKNCDQSLKEAEIYYRYPSETRRIKYAELVGLLEERTRSTEQQWADVLRRVEAAGVENVAVLDTATGEVTGHAGRFLIDEKLIPKLKFISEGHFTDKEGAPALKLVGDLEPISISGIRGATTVVRKEHITDADLLHEFVDRAVVENPRLYAIHIAHSTKLWLPVFYFMRKARLDEAGLIELLSNEPDTRDKHLKKVIGRIQRRQRPSLSNQYKPRSTEPERSQLLAGTLQAPATAKQCDRILKAVLTLRTGEIAPDHLLPILSRCLDAFGNDPLLLYAIAHVDVTWHEQIRAPKPKVVPKEEPASAE